MIKLPTQDLDHILEHTRDVWSEMAGARLFITGGTGFVGKWLLESLLWVDDQLHVGISAIVLTRDPERFREASPHLVNHRAVELLRGEMRSFDFPEGEFPFVIHAATERSFEEDVDGTRRVLEFASTHGVKRLLLTSSGAVYGSQPPDVSHIPEDYSGAPATTDPRTAYGQAKRVSEFLCAMYSRQYGFAALLARLFTFVGPHLPLNQHYAAGNFIRDVLAGGPVRVKGDGTPYRSYLYAADLAVWLWTILVRGEAAHPYNVGSDQAVTISELACRIVQTLAPGTRIEVAESPATGASALRYVPSVERARSELGLRPLIPLEEGMRRTYEWERKCGTLTD
jgi:nucleoside-diphosphate-sugar epimerase